MLVVCGQQNISQKICQILASSIAVHPMVVTSGAEARRITAIKEMEAVLLAGKLPDEDEMTLALELAQGGIPGVMVVINRSAIFDAHEVLDGSGVTILANPITKEALLHSISLVMKVSEGGGVMDRAKLMLIQYKGWTEKQAHRYIQKLSMDKRLPREVAAQLVLKALRRETENGR